MEGMNESFDVNKVFSDVEKYVEEYKSVDSGSLSENIKLYKALSVEVVSGLTDILKNVLSKPEYEGPKKPRSPIGFARLLTKSAIVVIHYGNLPFV